MIQQVFVQCMLQMLHLTSRPTLVTSLKLSFFFPHCFKGVTPKPEENVLEMVKPIDQSYIVQFIDLCKEIITKRLTFEVYVVMTNKCEIWQYSWKYTRTMYDCIIYLMTHKWK